MKYMEKLLHDWNGSIAIRDVLSCDRKPDMTIYSDASGISGYGCINSTTQLFGDTVWSKIASRVPSETSISSTRLEIRAICSAVLTLLLPELAFNSFVTLCQQSILLSEDTANIPMKPKALLLSSTDGVDQTVCTYSPLSFLAMAP